MPIDRARFYVNSKDPEGPEWMSLHMNDVAARNVMEILTEFGNPFLIEVAKGIRAKLPVPTVEFLCVGGPRHGAKVNLAMGATDYKFPVEVTIKATEVAPAQEQVLMVDLYVLVTIVVDGRSMKVLAYRNRA